MYTFRNGKYSHHCTRLMEIDPCWGDLEVVEASPDNKSVVARFCNYGTGKGQSWFVFNGLVILRTDRTVAPYCRFRLNYDGSKLAIFSAFVKGRKLELLIFQTGIVEPVTKYSLDWDDVHSVAWLDNDRVIYDGWKSAKLVTAVNGAEVDAYFEETTDGLELRSGSEKLCIDNFGVVKPVEDDFAEGPWVEESRGELRVRYKTYLGPKIDRATNDIEVSHDERVIAYSASIHPGWQRTLDKFCSTILDRGGCLLSLVFFLLALPFHGISYLLGGANRSIIKNQYIWKKKYPHVFELTILADGDLLAVVSNFSKKMVIIEEFSGPQYEEIYNVSAHDESVSYIGKTGNKLLRVEATKNGR